MGPQSKRQIAQQLADIINNSEALYTRIQGEWVRSAPFDRAALVLSGITISLSSLLDQIMVDIHEDESNAAIRRIFGNIRREDPPSEDSLDFS